MFKADSLGECDTVSGEWEDISAYQETKEKKKGPKSNVGTLSVVTTITFKLIKQSSLCFVCYYRDCSFQNILAHIQLLACLYFTYICNII